MMQRQEPITPQELADLRALLQGDEPEVEDWVRVIALALIAELDRVTYMWWRGGLDDLVTAEPAADGHMHYIVNGSHGCSCDEHWAPPPAESWVLPVEDGQ
jgi:hypothetical protein